MLAQSCSRSLKVCRPRFYSKACSSAASNRLYAVKYCLRSDGPACSSTRSILPETFPCSKTGSIDRAPRTLALGKPRAAAYTTDSSVSKYTAVKDDSHPSLFYHLFDDDELLNPVFSLSFLEERPSSVRSDTILGWLPALPPAQSESGGNGLNDFVPHHEFLHILHKAVKEGLLEDEMWTNSAIQTQSGWMHIFDQRKIPPLGRIPDPDDILASIRVEDGHMLIDTYEPMPSYRLCTADGVCQLTDALMERLKATLKQIAKDEKH